jgi:hypothetical protein
MSNLYNLKKGVATLDDISDVTATVAEVNTLDDGTAVKKFTETVAYDDFTDGGAAVGTIDLTNTIPVGAWVICALATAVTGFAGDTSAVVTLGDGSDVDRYNTGTPSVFATAANGVSLGAPSGTQYHATAATVTVTVTTATDFTSVSAGSLTIEFYYLT